MDKSVASEAPDDGAMMDTADWQARAGHIREVLAGAPDTAVAAALGTFLFADEAGKTWTYNGALWMSWDGSQWSAGSAPANLRLQPFLGEADAAVESSVTDTTAAKPEAGMASSTAAASAGMPGMTADRPSMAGEPASSMATDAPSMATEKPSLAADATTSSVTADMPASTADDVASDRD